MVNLESQRKLVEEYELLGRIIDADITFENSKDRTSGTCYLKCNTVFKVLNIKYEGEMRVLNNTKFKVFNNSLNGSIIVTNVNKDTMQEDVLFEYKGYINNIINANIVGFNQKRPLAVRVIRVPGEPVYLKDNSDTWNTSSEILKEPEPIIQGRFELQDPDLNNPMIHKDASSKLPSSYAMSTNIKEIKGKPVFIGDRCGNCKHILYPMSKTQTGICHLWKAQVKLPYWCQNWKRKEGE